MQWSSIICVSRAGKSHAEFIVILGVVAKLKEE